jgi:hypothetical protein
VSDAPNFDFVHYFKIGFAAAAGAIAAIALALSVVFVVNGVMGAQAERRAQAELEQMRRDFTAAIEEMRQREAEKSAP